MKNRVVIQRHGQSLYNAARSDRKYNKDPELDYDLIDAPLSDKGELECVNISVTATQELPGLAVIIVSPAYRAL